MLRQVFGVVGIASALIAASLSAASAADMPSYKGPALMPPPPPPPAYSWTGCYVDAGFGYGFWNQDHTTTGTPPGLSPVTTVTTTDGGRGWLGQFGAGCDYQTPLFNNRFVVGAFGDYDPMNLGGSNTPSEQFYIALPPPQPVGCPCAAPITSNATETDAWYVGGRIGYLLNPALLAFVDGGYTQTHFKQSGEFYTLTGAGIAFGYPNFTDPGWFVGGGMETALDWIPIRGLFLKTEYRYSQYNNISLAETSSAGVPTGNVENTKPYVQTATASLVWRFNWAGR
jgi:outer membrane immunogenic protein